MNIKISFFLKTILVFMSDASHSTRKLEFRKNECRLTYYPSAIVNNRSKIASHSLCAALSLIDKGISYSYNQESKTCLSFSKKNCSCSTQGNLFSPGMTMYDQVHDQEPVCTDKHCSNKGIAANTWTVFQRRFSGSESFNRSWDEYKKGFGIKNGEFWLGNDALHCLTANLDQELRIDIETTSGARYSAEYKCFSVGNAGSHYELSIGCYNGSAGDYLAYHNGAKFSTFDRDNDQNPVLNCAALFGAWWHQYASKACFVSNLNGIYGTYVAWYGISTQSHQSTTMMIRKRI